MVHLQAHSKPCPKCSVPVEKDGGCNLVVCGSCRQPFCWLCGAKTGTAHTWTVIEGHTCGEWKSEADRIVQDSKAKHERYMHYYNHFTVCFIAQVQPVVAVCWQCQIGVVVLLLL